MKNFIESAIFFTLGIVSGMPLSLTGSTFSMRLLDLGVKKETIGIFGLLAIGYSLKFLYAPLLDYFRVPLLKKFYLKRADWMMVFLSTASLGMWICSMVDDINGLFFIGPGALVIVNGVFFIGLGALVIGLSSAAFDIVCDGFRVAVVEKSRQGIVAAVFVYGYRVGMMISGALALLVADKLSWQHSYVMMLVCYLSLGIVAINFGSNLYKKSFKDQVMHERGNLLIKLKDIFLTPIADLMKKKHIVAFLFMVAFFKITDVYVGAMTNPFLVELGFTKTEIAAIVKLFGFIATLVGVGFGGYLTSKVSPEKVVIGAIVFQMFSNALFGVQYHFGHNNLVLSILISIENFSSAISNTVLVFLLSRACNIKFSGTQYALMTSIAAISRTTISAWSGVLATYVGWELFFICAGILEVPSLILAIYLMKKKVF